MTFQGRLEALGFSSYRQYLKSAHWKDVRRRYRQSSLTKRCRICKSKKYDLHHVTYRRLGFEELTDLVPLCKTHHTAIHEIHKERRIPLREFSRAAAILRRSIARSFPCPSHGAASFASTILWAIGEFAKEGITTHRHGGSMVSFVSPDGIPTEKFLLRKANKKDFDRHAVKAILMGFYLSQMKAGGLPVIGQKKAEARRNYRELHANQKGKFRTPSGSQSNSAQPPREVHKERLPATPVVSQPRPPASGESERLVPLSHGLGSRMGNAARSTR